MGLNHMRWARRKEPKCVSWTYKPPADDNWGSLSNRLGNVHEISPPW